MTTRRRILAYLFLLVALGFGWAMISVETPGAMLGCLAGGAVSLLGADVALSDTW